jgi:hypothetical protein
VFCRRTGTGRSIPKAATSFGSVVCVSHFILNGICQKNVNIYLRTLTAVFKIPICTVFIVSNRSGSALNKCRLITVPRLFRIQRSKYGTVSVPGYGFIPKLNYPGEPSAYLDFPVQIHNNDLVKPNFHAISYRILKINFVLSA